MQILRVENAKGIRAILLHAPAELLLDEEPVEEDDIGLKRA